MPDVFALLESGLEFACGAKRFLSSNKSTPRLNREISQALRAIYFTPNGVLSLLKEVAEGRHPDPERTKELLIEFNDKEWNVRESLDALDFDRLSKQLGLTLGTARKLDLIRFGKLSLRREIQSEINYYGQRRASPDKRKVHQLLAAIEQLNCEIEDIERLVNVEAKER